MSHKYKKVCTTLNYIEHFLIWASSFLLGVPIRITRSTKKIGLKSCAVTAGIKKRKSKIKKEKKTMIK